MSRATAMQGLAVAALLLLTPVPGRAQSTQQQIDSAKSLYEQFNVEAARPILLRIVSPGYPLQVSTEQKAAAYKYLGASYAVLANGDSATTFFMAAIDFDPFTDLDPTKFAATELGAFNEAKSKIFKIGIQPMRGPALIVPQSLSDTAAYVFRLILTQRATLRVDLVKSDSSVIENLFDGVSDGLRPVLWRGLLSNGNKAPPGVYQLRATGIKAGQQPLTETMGFRVEHAFEMLEDSLPPLDTLRRCQAGCDMLPERIPSAAPWSDLIKGGALAAVAVALPVGALGKTKGDVSWAAHAGAAAGVAAISGGISFSYRRKNPQIPQNVAENARRKAVRARFNAAVKQRNQDRLDKTLLIISPISASFGQ